jgi:hypothetical protein
MKRATKRHLKRDVLGLLAKGGSWGHGEIARNADFWPIRAVSTYMRRLERQGLVRSVRSYKRVVWQIAEKGCAIGCTGSSAILNGHPGSREQAEVNESNENHCRDSALASTLPITRLSRQ